MINLPLFGRLDIDDYGLYVGHAEMPGLHATFQPGLSLVIGANGLGKSTLVLILYRLCSGPNDLANVRGQTQLGNLQLSVSSTNWTETRTFAARVEDEAAHATATLSMYFGSTKVAVTRRLKNLELVALRVDDELVEGATERDYQEQVTGSAGVDSFIDWLLVLRYLTFYGDDRRSLVWDKSAQRQLLRILFLPPNESNEWLALEREYLQKASQFRNYRAQLSREEASLTREEARLANVPTLTAQIDALAKESVEITAMLDSLGSELAEAESNRRVAQLAALRASEDRENAYRRLEHSRLQEILAAFPSGSLTAAYILSQLMSSDHCAVCGNEVPELASALAERVANHRCVVCGTQLNADPTGADADVGQLESDLDAVEVRLRELNESRDQTATAHAVLLEQVSALERRLLDIQNEVQKLNGRLPGADRKVREHRVVVQSMQATAKHMRAQADAAGSAYENLVRSKTEAIASRKDDVKALFDHYATEFLFDTCQLSWDAYPVQMGQMNEPINFYLFEVEMTGNGATSVVRRSAAEEVSESQQEFIDLAFRMALITAAASEGAGTMVIDTPESSLDAVFAPRAARVLADFGKPSRYNRLVVTSNLIDGALIPTLVELSGIADRSDARIVDLIDIAEPTAAVRANREDYNLAVSKIFSRAGSSE